MLGAMVIGTQAANADTQVDSNHVRVEQGDTVSGIAQKHNVSVDSLVQANHMSNPDMIFVGDTLVLTPNADNNNNQSANVQNNVQPASQATNNVAPAQATNTTNNQATQTPSDGDSQHMNQPVHMIENNENTVNNNQPATTVQQSAPVATNGSSSVHDQFINAGGTEAMWSAIVMPESGGNPNATNGQYSGLGQTNQSWGAGSVAEQTQGMINYANSRYGSISNAIAFRASNGWW